ncbi:MAG: type II secretion system F family protein, partial [Armatimonadetes bacterium]|nr:type II secretion system F family protein [Armatimonadota bacterium]
MPIYSYKAITLAGKMKSGKIEAISEARARMLLRRSGEQVVAIKELFRSLSEREHKSTTSRSRGAPADEVAVTIRQLSILVRAGVPLVEALQGLAEQSRSVSLGICLREIGGDISQGMALSAAFSRHPSIFPVLAGEMARVAEAGGNLAESMARLADHMESGAEIKRRVKSALAYPMVIVVISFITVIVMSTFILPRFVMLFE